MDEKSIIENSKKWKVIGIIIATGRFEVSMPTVIFRRNVYDTF